MSKSIYQTAWINLLPKLKKRHLFKSPWGLGEIKHTIIIISISFHGWRCIMIPHADFVLTLAIIGMSKLLYICTQIKHTKLFSYLIQKRIAIIAFFANCSFLLATFKSGQHREWNTEIICAHSYRNWLKTNVEILRLPKQLYRSSFYNILV